jgi:glyoxylase-like metal-dependent hydrolase (beta-lactamase superfamily II)
MSATSVKTIDCHYGGPEIAAAYLVAEGNRAAFVDNNTTRAVPLLLAALDETGVSPNAVEYLIVTHIHLDHAGGTAALLEHCPSAVVVCHPRAARHLANPKRLVAGVMHVYGREVFEKLYGEIRPIDEHRIRPMDDGEELRMGGRVFRFLHTPGHATHHCCIHDSRSNGVFAGDAFGLHYPSLQRGRKPCIMCSSTPTEFDAEAARASVRRIVETGASRVYVGHFGEVTNVGAAADMLLASIDDMENVMLEAVECGDDGDALEAFCRARVEAAVLSRFSECGVKVRAEERARLDADIWINARGLALAAEKMRRRPHGQAEE